MIRKLLIAGAILLVGAIAVKKLHFDRYICSAVHHIRQRAQDGIPTEVQFEWLEDQIAHMDRDIQKLAKPLAELDFDIHQHKKEIGEIKTALTNGKKNLTEWVNFVDSGSPVFEWRGREYSRQQMNRKLSQEFVNFKRLETQLQTKEKLLEAKQKQFDAIYDQADKLAAKKREFEIRLANLRAQEEQIKVADIANRPHRENGRVKEIDDAMRRIEKRQWVKEKTRELVNSGPFVTEDQRPTQQDVPEVNTQQIRNYLNPTQAVKKE